jgi:hypothetical protein
MDEPQGRCEWAWRRENLLPPPGFEIQTIQPIASCYNDYAELDISLQTAKGLDVELPEKMVSDQHKDSSNLKKQYSYWLGKAKYFL